MRAVEIEKLTFGYRDKLVLRDVSLEVYENEFVSILGPNGSGKSTLLKCIVGICRPWSGKVRIFEREVSTIPKRELNRIIGYLPQETSPPPSLMTVYEYILLGRIHYLSGKLTVSEEDHRAVIEVVNLLGLREHVKRYMSELSGGEKQLVYLAQALVKRPRVFILDEPLNHLDIRNQFRVLRVLRELRTKLSITVIIVLHDINQAARYSDRIIIMSEGKVVCEGEPSEVVVPHILERIYGVRFRVVYDDGIPQVIPSE